MSERKKRTGKVSGVEGQLKKLEASVAEFAARLEQIELQLSEQWDRFHEFGLQIAEARGQIETSGGQNRSEGLITLEEGSAVDLEGWERRIDEKCALLSAKQRELPELEKKMYGELERLRSEMTQRDLLLAAREVEIRSLKQSLASRLDDLEGLVHKRSRGKKATRLVSFLADIGKKH